MRRMLPQADWMGRGSRHQFHSLTGLGWSGITGANFSRGFFMACGTRVGTNKWGASLGGDNPDDKVSEEIRASLISQKVSQ